MIDYTRPEGTHISQTQKDIQKIETYLLSLPQVKATTAFIGQGGLRFLMTYEPEMPNPAYGQILVTVDDYRKIDSLLPEIRQYLAACFSG